MSGLYQRLQVDKTASQAEIRRAYRRLALLVHPDRHRGDKSSEAAFKTIATAFEILGDPKARSLYDAGRIDDQGRPTDKKTNGRRSQGKSGHGKSFGWDGAGGPNGSEVFKKAQGDTSERSASQADGKVKKKSSMVEKQYRLAIGFVEACLGAVKRVRLPDGHELKISIPAGVDNGQRLRVNGAGDDNLCFVVKVSVEPHMLFKREGKDISFDVPLTPYEAYFGVELDLPTAYGPIKVTVPPESQSGDAVRVEGFGIRRKGLTSGDLVVRFEIAMPAHWPARLKSVMTAWSDEAPYNPRSRITRILAG